MIKSQRPGGILTEVQLNTACSLIGPWVMELSHGWDFLTGNSSEPERPTSIHVHIWISYSFDISFCWPNSAVCSEKYANEAQPQPKTISWELTCLKFPEGRTKKSGMIFKAIMKWTRWKIVCAWCERWLSMCDGDIHRYSSLSRVFMIHKTCKTSVFLIKYCWS